jgi:hypothetical protein
MKSLRILYISLTICISFHASANACGYKHTQITHENFSLNGYKKNVLKINGGSLIAVDRGEWGGYL